MSQQQNSPSWGAPAGAAWGSPVVDTRPGRNSPNHQQTPVHANRDNRQMNRSGNGGSNRGSHPYRLSSSNSSPSSFNCSPRHFQPRPRFQSSPLGTPNAMRFNNSMNNSQQFTPSPRGRGNNSFNSHRKSFSHQRDRSSLNNNPGGSSNINDYIHPSMLEDPWKDLQPKQLLKQY